MCVCVCVYVCVCTCVPVPAGETREGSVKICVCVCVCVCVYTVPTTAFHLPTYWVITISYILHTCAVLSFHVTPIYIPNEI